MTGLEEFEDKVNKIAIGDDNNSWIGQIYEQFSNNFDIDGSKLDDDDIGDKEGLELLKIPTYMQHNIVIIYMSLLIFNSLGLEPPILDETWGLEDIHKLHEHEEGNTT